VPACDSLVRQLVTAQPSITPFTLIKACVSQSAFADCDSSLPAAAATATVIKIIGNWCLVNQDTLGSRPACEAVAHSALQAGLPVVIDRYQSQLNGHAQRLLSSLFEDYFTWLLPAVILDCCCEHCNWGTDAACACSDLAGATSM
jgi:hypothetical protein